MKNLYKKIYEAINTGIQKALVLNDEDDISINYQHKKIVNNSNVISYFVEELLNNFNNEYNYEQIIKYYEETGYTYKVKNFNELKGIFDKIKDIENVSWEWISNMEDYISIILEDNSEINFYEKTNKKSLFLKLANDDILGTENEILIYLYDNHYIPKEVYQWQTKEEIIQSDEHLINMEKYRNWEKTEKVANKNYSGYENCLRIQDIVSKKPKKYGKTPAIEYCLKLNDINGYQGYLPSMGQLRIMSDNIDLINYIFKYLKLNEIKDFNDGHLCDWWWSSTENSNYTSWVLGHGITHSHNKVDDFDYIFPLFTVKKN
ncbi:MAG: hypothetical protein [Wendovervirus sonii]|uniref:Uncharacterized protein n=1 Tax=phage Lak_Megaphage_Sonny TaxID=3109229 RepID=A0ABZ0Z418_9CAUD|nr:MAG: hypothetical protein [phage Lak_Megaphage_Sonny]